MRRGQSTLPASSAGGVLDRLLLLEQVIGPEQVQQALLDTGCCDTRRCRLTRAVIFWVVLARGMLTTQPIRQVFKACRRLRAGERTPHRSSLCLARQRLGLPPVRRRFERVVRLLATPQTPGAFYKGWRLMALDDTVRRNRINPRVVRQKMSKFKKKRPEHRHLPPLKKTFAMTVVILR